MSDLVDPGSFRDPSGQIYHFQDKIYRTIEEDAAKHYCFARDSGLLAEFSEQGLIVPSEEVDPAILGPAASSASYVVEHPKLPLISYP